MNQNLQSLDENMILGLKKIETRNETIDLTKYTFLVKAIAHKFRKKFGNKFDKIEDTEAYSIAALELVKAAAEYDPSINEDFSRYAFRVMRNGIIEAIRHRNRQKRTAEFTKLTSLEWEEIEKKKDQTPSGAFQELHAVLLGDHPDDTAQDRADKILLNEIYIQGKKIPLIAEKYGISRVTVYSRIRRIIDKIRQRHKDLITWGKIDEFER